MDNEFLLEDRLEKIKSVINKYGEKKFYISFSGGKDSTVLSALVDMALPNNKIPRVYADTGIELNMVRDFVFDMQKTDDRVAIIKPSVPIRQMLEKEGYPFKSKEHSLYVSVYQNSGNTKSVIKYLAKHKFGCPKLLRYQFTPTNKLKISRKCCYRLKEQSLHLWEKEHRKCWTMLGIMRSEGGARTSAKCLTEYKNGQKIFSPLSVVTKEWENWFIDQYHVQICKIYKPPYNFERTGCKGCPYAINLQKELDTLAVYFPAERKQCEIIWKPVYAEYRRLGYRLRREDEDQIKFDI